MPAGCFDPRAQDAHFLGSFLKGDSGMLSSSFLIQLYLLHSTLHKHSRNLFHLVAFSTLLLRDCPLGTKLRTLLLSSGGVQQKKTVRRKANTQSCVQVSVDSRLSTPSLHQPGPGPGPSPPPEQRLRELPGCLGRSGCPT